MIKSFFIFFLPIQFHCHYSSVNSFTRPCLVVFVFVSSSIFCCININIIPYEQIYNLYVCVTHTLCVRYAWTMAHFEYTSANFKCFPFLHFYHLFIEKKKFYTLILWRQDWIVYCFFLYRVELNWIIHPSDWCESFGACFVFVFVF